MASRAVAISLLLCAASGAGAGAQRPNILLLVAEDLSPRIGAFGDPHARTPRLDALAREGVRFTQVFTTAGVCAPSRAALITGRHQNAIGAQHMRSGNAPTGGYRAVPPPQVKAFPELLRAAGYYTFTDSKLDYQFSGVRAGSGPFTIWDAEGADASWHGREAGQPFFGMINFQVTHESGTFAPLGTWPHSALHLLLQAWRAWSYGSEPAALMPDPATLVLPPYYPDSMPLRLALSRHYGNIAYMDREVGALLDALSREGLADDTIVIWTSDHGDGLPRAKRELHDSGIHVPLIVRWPARWHPRAFVPGTADARLLSFVDLAPVVLGMAGIAAPAWMQGRDAFAIAADAREYVFAARDRIDTVIDRQRAVRDARYKYIRSWHPELPDGHELAFRDNLEGLREMRALWRSGRLEPAAARWFEPPGAEQLYDLAHDPHELHNLAADAAHAPVLARLRAALDDWLERTGDLHEVEERQMASDFLCNGRACETPAPRIRVLGRHIELQAPAACASLGYRLDDGPWRLYTAPFDAGRAQRLQAKAQCYGHEASETVERVLRESGS